MSTFLFYNKYILLPRKKRGGEHMGRKYNMRTPEEKERIIKNFRNGNIGINQYCKQNGVSKTKLYVWIKKYDECGIEGLNSRTGKTAGQKTSKNKGIHLRKPKNREEELEIQVIKLHIENERLKKGYTVKGDGAKKEYVSTLEKNTK